MINTEFKSAYSDHVSHLEGKLTVAEAARQASDHVSHLEGKLTVAEAARQAVGGEFDAVGKLEYHLVRSEGLSDGDLVVDVGCGSGRLACQLAPLRGVRYVGCDVIPCLLDHASALADRRDWTFALTDGTKIPCGDGAADYVLFFSVFTHLLHEDTFNYFREAHRCLKPGGCMIFSFLEFQIPCHWNIFIASVEHATPGQHLNQFIDRAAVRAWAAHAGFEVEAIHDGDKGHIPLPEEVVWENGNRMSSFGNLGQSVGILRKR